MPVFEEIQAKFDKRVVAVFGLLQHLRTILQYLHAWDDVGIDADGERSFGMAAEQRRLLSDEVGQAKECVCELDRSPLLLDIATALGMIEHTLEVGETLARSAMDCGDEDRAIGHIKEAVCTSFEETASALNRLAASLLPKELIGRIDAETERLQCEYARLQHEQQAGNGAGPEEGQSDGKGSGLAETSVAPGQSWSRIMPLRDIADRIYRSPKRWRSVLSHYGNRMEQIGGKGSHKWQIRLDGLPENIVKELNRP